MWLPLISWAIISDLFNFQILQETSMKVWNEIQFIFSSGAWSKFADIQWLQKNYLLSFIPFLLFILIVLIFPSKDWKTKKNLSPSVAVRRKHFKYTHIFWKLLFSQSLCHSFQFLKWFISKICWHGKLSKYCLQKGKKIILIEMLNFSRVTLYTFTVEFQPLPVQQILLQGNI